ncbi:hypothetical protein DM01DRAFT_1135245 [Hesseltinella vesiculosa]|uniref:Uncharacterized protein n=1 Tax=Hesseltinella vesiculosa TaxID=101127 RepID=A0A1X2G8Y6_9FUNG|nr:hypothetical protein DM01DRAFT_1135245 [Hesseltinella vesiculosa]
MTLQDAQLSPFTLPVQAQASIDNSFQAECNFVSVNFLSLFSSVLGDDAGAELAQASGQFFLPRLWTDHHLVYVDLTLQRPTMGPGTWRFNNQLLGSELFMAQLEQLLAAFHSRRKRPDLSPQKQWEDMKTSVQILATNVSRKLKVSQAEELANLQARRTSILQALPNDRQGGTESSLDKIDNSIDRHTQRHMEGLRIRSATRWLEEGERNTKLCQILQCSRLGRHKRSTRCSGL